LANKSAQKAVRASGRKQKRNQAARSKVKTDIARAEQLIAAGDLEAAQNAVKIAIIELDKAAGKKILHANNTARRKSRLLKKLSQAAAAKPKSSKSKKENE
jgi:small subunit ribosomal protein S20